MSTQLVHIFHLATGKASGNSRLMKYRLNINSVNLHHRFLAEESELDMKCGFTGGQDHCYFAVMEPTYSMCEAGLTARCKPIKRKYHCYTCQSVMCFFALIMSTLFSDTFWQPQEKCLKLLHKVLCSYKSQNYNTISVSSLQTVFFVAKARLWICNKNHRACELMVVAV